MNIYISQLQKIIFKICPNMELEKDTAWESYVA